MKTQVLTAPGTCTGSVLICDDRPRFAEALGAQLATPGELVEVLGVVHDGPALLAALERTAFAAGHDDGPELLFIGVHRGSSAGLDAVRLVRSPLSRGPGTGFRRHR